jgi:hypothetical protein
MFITLENNRVDALVIQAANTAKLSIWPSKIGCRLLLLTASDPHLALSCRMDPIISNLDSARGTLT